MNPMLLNAQLQALAAQSNPLLSGMYGSQFHPGLLQAQQSAALAERLRAMQAVGAGSPAVGSTPGGGPTEGPTRGASTGNRYSPYPLPSPPTSSCLSLGSPTHSTSSSSAFSAVKKSVVTSEHQGPVKTEGAIGSLKAPSTDLKIPPISSPTRQPTTSPHRPSSHEATGDQIMTENESVGAKSEIKEETSQHTKISDIKNMEELVNGLNGSAASKFGISHNNNDQQISA
jgi:hypothetical protein